MYINFSVEKSVQISKKIFSLTQFNTVGRKFSYFCVKILVIYVIMFPANTLNASFDVVLVDFECAVRDVVNAA